MSTRAFPFLLAVVLSAARTPSVPQLGDGARGDRRPLLRRPLEGGGEQRFYLGSIAAPALGVRGGL